MNQLGVVSARGHYGSILQEQKSVGGAMHSKSTTGVLAAVQISPLEGLDRLELPQSLAVLSLLRG
jgi:hypothetical protein